VVFPVEIGEAAGGSAEASATRAPGGGGTDSAAPVAPPQPKQLAKKALKRPREERPPTKHTDAQSSRPLPADGSNEGSTRTSADSRDDLIVSGLVKDAQQINQSRREGAHGASAEPPKGTTAHSAPAKAPPKATTAPSAPPRAPAAASAASPMTKASSTSAARAPMRLARWRCVGGAERWTLTERRQEEADDAAVASELVMDRAALDQHYGAEKAARMLKEWEESEVITESMTAGGAEYDWYTLLKAARTSPRDGPPNCAAACCRLLLLLETSVLEKEMDKLSKNGKWSAMRPNWCKKVRQLGLGQPLDGADFDGSSVGGNLAKLTEMFLSRVATAALTDAFAHERDALHGKLNALRESADEVWRERAAEASASSKRRRPSRGAAEAAGETSLSSFFVGFDSSEWLRIMHAYGDGLRRWQDEAAALRKAQSA
jgi:hypothetical protein